MAHEGDQFARDRGDDDVGMFAARHQPTKPLAEPYLRLPAEILQRLRQPVDALLDVEGHFGRVTIGPGRFDQDAARASMAGFW